MSTTASTHEELMDEGLTAAEQQERVWKRLKGFNGTTPSTVQSFSSEDSSQRRTWPTYDKVVTDMAAADYTHTLTCPFDLLKHNDAPSSSSSATTTTPAASKSLCPHGVVCRVRMELFDFPEQSADASNKAYTGLLSPGTTNEHCLLRLSSAMKPPNEAIRGGFARSLLYATGHKLRNAKLFPCAALKVFRDGRPSGNLLFGGSKLGQREVDYFAHCQSTSMTERMPRAIKPFVRKFWSYSAYPLSLGVSEFCSYNAAGEETSAEALNFPFAVIIKPCISMAELAGSGDDDSADNAVQDAESAFDNFLDHVLKVPENTVLFEIFACADPHDVPDPSKLQRIGRLVTTSAMIPSVPNDGIFFKHQKKEDDYNLRPSWQEALGTKIAIDNGETKGTVGQLVGWKLFEQHIAQGTFVDFEKTY